MRSDMHGDAEHAAQSAALELVRGAQRFLLVGHRSPDGDCAGSQAALAGALESLGKQVWILNPDPLQSQLDHLSRGRRYGVYTGGSLPAHDVAVALDFSEFTRCGALREPLAAAPSRKLVIDHHPVHGAPWWDAAWLDVAASSTGILVHRLARALGAKLDATAALGVFTALVTDTGWFKYSNTDAESLRVAAEMVDLGVEPARIFAAVFQRAARERPLGIARALSRLRYHAGGRLAVVTLPAAAPGEADLADGDEVLDLMRAVERVEVALFLRQSRAGEIKLSARSKGGVDVDRLARRFGGGGHVRASGASLTGDLDARCSEVVAAALEALAEAEVGA
jgi:phosphoesterase RecJ-like protein